MGHGRATLAPQRGPPARQRSARQLRAVGVEATPSWQPERVRQPASCGVRKVPMLKHCPWPRR
eukprot:9863129-Lingulodinium_polyedra.AAC.1